MTIFRNSERHDNVDIIVLQTKSHRLSVKICEKQIIKLDIREFFLYSETLFGIKYSLRVGRV